MATRELTMLDLFAGAGGLSEGLREAGFRSLYANEIIPTYAATFALNHPDSLVDSRDIRAVNATEVREKLGLRRGELDLMAGGPPCQGFSINAPKRSSEDKRNHLFREYLRFVEEFQPRAVLIENVPGLVSFDNGGTLGAILKSLEDLNYTADVQILYAPHYGVPQTRWRTIVLALRDGVDARTAFLPTFTTVSDAIGDLPVLLNGEAGAAVKNYPSAPQNEYQRALRAGSDGVHNHEAARLGMINLERLSHIPPGGNWTDIPFDLLPAGMKLARRSDHTKRYGRVAPDGLASTILTKCDPHWGAYFHYSQERAFTVREAARIQSFPDTYRFTGSRADQYEQVGNAVPPLLGAAVGQAISAALGVDRPALLRVV
jgi:DNA (cytosine-5)-methyltransferase 1